MMWSKRNIWFGYSFSVVIIIAIGVFSYRTLLYLEVSNLQVNQSHRVIEHLHEFSSALKDVQRGARGYILSGNPEYLSPYYESIRSIPWKLNTLRRMDGTGAEDQARIDSLQRYTLEFIDYYTSVISYRSNNGLDSTVSVIKQGKGKKISDRILSIVMTMMDEEEALLRQQEWMDNDARSTMKNVLIFGTGMALFFIIGASALVVLENNRRQAAEASLRLQAIELQAAKERAETADRLKTNFLNTMSHELRTPLNSIIGYTDIIQQGRSGPVTAEQQGQLKRVLNNSRHILRLINDALDIAKIEAGKLTIRQAPFDAAASIQKCVEMIAPLADEKGIVLRTSIAASVGTMIGDNSRTEQILINLLNNAVKFTEAGSVTIDASVTKDRPAESLIIRVIDTGIGIGEHDLPNIFQPFHQIDPGSVNVKGGTGLGLSISKKLAQLLGGDIQVVSTLGNGTTFTVSIPVNDVS